MTTSRICVAATSLALACATGAQAEPVVPQIENAVTDAFPAESAPLPLNAIVVFFGISAGFPVFTRGSQFIQPFDTTFNAFLVNTADLIPPPAPGETLTITASCEGCDVTRTWTFGDDVDDIAPTIEPEPVEQLSLTVSTGRSAAYVGRLLVPAIRDEQPRLIHLTDEGGKRVLFPAARAAATMIEHEFGEELGATGEHCADIEALDVSFNRTFIGTHCFALEDAVDVTPPGCTQSRGALSIVSVLALLLLLRTQRRAR